MPNGNRRRDLEWLKRVLRKHSKRSWRRVVARLEAQRADGLPHASIRKSETNNQRN